MAIRVVPYELGLQPAAQAFDARLRAAGMLVFPTGDAPPPPPNEGEAAHGIRFDRFLAVDGDDAVRGAYFIRSQPFLIRGRVMTAGHYSAPISEGIVDKRYAAVGPIMLAHALRQQRLLFAMGMGGLDRPLPRLLKSMGWTMLETPFFFRVLNARGFLRGAGPLRSTRLRRFGSGALAISGTGSAAIHLAQRMRTRTSFDSSSFQPQTLTEFGAWADTVWNATRGMYSFSAVRNAACLQYTYPESGPPWHGIRLTSAGETVGWAQLLDCKVRQRSYFGTMKVMALVDGVAPAAAVSSLVAASVRVAQDCGADLIFSNQMHAAWAGALRKQGFWQGPSNYLLALSKELAALLGPLSESAPLIHFNRGDGDGMVNLSEDVQAARSRTIRATSENEFNSSI